MTTNSEIRPKSHALIRAETKKNCAQFPINARDFIRCERDRRGGRTIIRIVRVKPCSSGGVRAAGPLIEFADKHLASVIAILQVLQESEAGSA